MTFVLNLRLVGILISICLAPQFTWAAKAEHSPAVQRLIEQHDRPTVAQLKAALSPWPEKNPFQGTPNQTTLAFTEELAYAIATFEHAFPGGIYAGLGRDVVGLVDMMDAFYQSLGQSGRAVRINASTPTLASASNELIIAMLKGIGFDLAQMPDRSFVVFDNSWYRDSSQTVRIIRAVYQTYKAMGGDPTDLLEKFYAVNLHDSHQKRVELGFNREAFMATAANSLTTDAYPTTVMSFPTRLKTGATIYTTEWHDKFDRLVMQPDGTAVAKPGVVTAEDLHEQILYELYQIIDGVQKPSFLKLVEQYAAKQGVTLSLHSTCRARLKAAQ